MFRPASGTARLEIASRRGARALLRPFGIKFLDDSLIGIAPGDLVLIGAASGIGKTQLCCNIALANLADGKRVHFLALEAEEFEIERRLKYQIVASSFFADPNRPRLERYLSYDLWRLGDFLDPLEKYETMATEFMERAYGNLNVFYKTSSFTITDLIESVCHASPESDLFIIDHAHYFDFDDDNENRAMKDLARTVRDLAIERQKPIILVAHLRKRDRANEDLVPGIDEFHGSSDLTKIATRVVTISPGGRTTDGRYETFFRVPKNRLNGGTNRYVGRALFDPKVNAYEEAYKIGDATLTRKTGFEELDHSLYPEWARQKA